MLRSFSMLMAAFALACVTGCGPAAGNNSGDNNASGGTNDGAPVEAVVPEDGTTIRIAVCGPITGSAAAFGDMIQKAAKLKEKEVNAAGGVTIGGKQFPVAFEIFDDKGDTTEATNVARKVTSDDGLLAVVGHFNSTCSLAAKDQYNRVGIVEFSPGSTNVTVCAGGPYTFRNLYRDDTQGESIAAYMATVLNVTKVAVLYDNDDYGKGLKNSFSARAAEVGMAVVAEAPYLRERTQDFKPLVQQAKDGGAEAIFIAGLYNEAALITKAARGDLSLKIPIMGGDGVMSPDYIKLAGDAANGALISTPFLFGTKEQNSPEAQAFFDAFNEAYSKNPDTWAALTYDACGQILECISKAGASRKGIRDVMASQTTAATGYNGVTGVTFFDAEGDCQKPIFVAVVRDKAFVPADKQMSPE